MEIVFLNTLNDYWNKKLPTLEREFPLVKFIKNNNLEDRLSLLKTADAVVSGRLSQEDLENAPNLKVLFVPFTGLNTFPVELLKEQNIFVSNTHANYNYVAEKAVSLALALLGRIVELHNDLQKGIWNLNLIPSNYWTTIQGKSCAVLGYGKIGRCIAKFLKAFDCKIIAFKRNCSNEEPYADEVTNDLNDALKKCDLIFLTLPLTDKTKGIISKDVLENMKGKFLINVGRGDLIDEEGLYLALKNGILAGAAIDVWYNYPGRVAPEPVYPSHYPIHELNNVVLSPHKSAHAKESIEAMIDDTINNIRTYLRTGVPSNIVIDNY